VPKLLSLRLGLHRLIALFVLAALFVVPAGAFSQPASVPPDYQAASLYAPEELDQLVSPIALYPDPLIAQILMSATYPLEVVQADRWLQDPANSALKGEALEAALAQEPWAPSVKALVPFPQVLWMMDRNIDWTERLGNAFLAQESDVMAAIQRLRQRAMAAGTLVSTPEQVVSYEGPIIIIEPASASILYVPVYDPWHVYGPWPYPAYPPYYFLPPSGFYLGTVISGIGFEIGIRIIAPLWGWSRFDWHRRRVDIDVRRFNVLNAGRPSIATPVWRHDPYHRRGVPYRNAATRARFAPGTIGTPERRELRGYPAGPAPRAPTPLRQPSGAQQQRRVPQQPAPRQFQRTPQAPAQRQIQRELQRRPPQPQTERSPRQPMLRQRQLTPQPPAQRPMRREIQRPAQPPPSRPLSPAFQSFGPGRNAREDAARGRASRQTMPQRSAPRGGGPTRGGERAPPSGENQGRPR
jgi:hypothetical protein